MKSFTYGDYIKFIHKYRLHAIMNLMEESVKYERNIINRKEEEIYDKFIRELIKNKYEMQDMIKTVNWTKNNELLRFSKLEFVGNKRMKTRFNLKNVDGLYKIYGKEIYLAIEYQKDCRIGIKWRMMNYCIDIMKDWLTKEKNKDKNQFPIIIPIVLQNGKIERNIKDENCEFEVNIIDIKKFLMQKRFD